MKKRWIFIVAALAAVTSDLKGDESVSSFIADRAEMTVNDLDSLVGQWMEIRTAIAGEKRDWLAKKQQWEIEIQLLEAEKAKLQNELESISKSVSDEQVQRSETIKNKEKIEQVLDELDPILSQAELSLRFFEPYIPLVTGDNIAKNFAELPATPQQATELGLTDRIVRIAALFSQIETIQNNFYVSQEMLNVKGGKRQVDVLYIGIARAFAVSSDNDWAAVGFPAENGWQWNENADIAMDIRTAIEVYNHHQTAKLVALPMQVKEVESK